jgi:hypothetical protein
MNNHMRRLGRLAGLGAVAAVVLATVSPAGVSAAAKPDSCPTDKPLVVNSYATYENAADYGADGHIWALDTATHSIQIWQLGGNAYCMKVHDVGTFTTFAGLSPEGTGNVSAGVTGTNDGTFYVYLFGTFAPAIPTTGFVGNFDFQCQQDGNCRGPGVITRLYFPSLLSYHYGAFEFTADAGACGTWFQSSSGDTGDIVC